MSDSALELDLNNAESLGKVWVAIRKDQVISMISMRVPKDVDFDVFRDKAVSCLSEVGNVKAGELWLVDGERYFVQRLNHANRSKNKDHRKPKVIKL